jgi:tellurite resistance protein TerC
LAIFALLDIDRDAQRRVLGWGFLGALVTRAVLIGVATSTAGRWTAVSVALGAAMLASAAWTAIRPQRAAPPSARPVLTRFLPIAQDPTSRRFIVREAGRLRVTHLAVALVSIELADAVFSLDSVPTAFAVTSDPVVLYASNVLAAILLLVALAGVKLLLSPWWSPPTWVAGTTFGVLAGGLGVVKIIAAIRARPAGESNQRSTQVPPLTVQHEARRSS